MSDNRADAAQLLLVTHILIVDLAAEDARHNVDGVVLGIVEGIDLRRLHCQLIPFILIYSGVDLLRLESAYILIHRSVRRQQAAAILNPGKVEC